jgi:hypothetical protein
MSTGRLSVSEEKLCSMQLVPVSASLGSSVSIVSDYGLDDRGSIPDRGRGFFL